MRFLLVTLFVTIGLAGCADVPPTAGGIPLFEDRQVLVLTDGDPETLITKTAPLGYVVTRIDPLEELRETLIHFRIPQDRTIPEAIEEIETLEPGVTAGANHAYRLQSVEEELSFAHDLIGWPAQGCRAYRQIGLVDAGVAPNHPGVQSGQIVQQAFHRADGLPRTDHGTLMAELLVGDGRLTGARLHSANAVDPGQGGGDIAGVDGILRSVNWLQSVGVDLINISLAGPFNKLLNRGLGQAAEDGVVFVAAAGNLGPNADPQYPAAFPFVLAVTAVDRNLAVYRNAVQGDHIDMAAPGVDIVITSEGSARVLSGTSAAAPYVTAIIASDRSLRSARSVDAVMARLQAGSRDLGPAGNDPVFGAGLAQAPTTCVPPG